MPTKTPPPEKELTLRELAFDRLDAGIRKLRRGEQPPPVIRQRPPRVRPARPILLVDALSAFATLRGTPETVQVPFGRPEIALEIDGLIGQPEGTLVSLPAGLPRDHATTIVPASGPIRGAERIIEKLESWHIRLEMFRGQLLVSTTGGAMPPGEAGNIIATARPMLEAHLRGEPLTCRIGEHPEPVIAVTLTWPTLNGACAECMSSPFDGKASARGDS